MSFALASFSVLALCWMRFIVIPYLHRTSAHHNKEGWRLQKQVFVSKIYILVINVRIPLMWSGVSLCSESSGSSSDLQWWFWTARRNNFCHCTWQLHQFFPLKKKKSLPLVTETLCDFACSHTVFPRWWIWCVSAGFYCLNPFQIEKSASTNKVVNCLSSAERETPVCSKMFLSHAYVLITYSGKVKVLCRWYL